MQGLAPRPDLGMYTYEHIHLIQPGSKTDGEITQEAQFAASELTVLLS